jgi:hypothetical protein
LDDLTDRGLFMLTEAFSLVLVSGSLLILVNVGDASAVDLLFRKPAIFRNPLLSGEFLFLSSSDANGGEVECEGDRSEVYEVRVARRCTLEAHDVGAEDCDWIEL